MTAITYTFEVAAPPTTSTPLALGERVSGTLAQPGQIDDYTFTGSDAQLDAAIKYLQDEIRKDPRPVPQHPPYPNKSFSYD